MKLTAPDYYPLFRCIAGACRHSCCIGWEIDVDEDSLARYQQVQGDMGRRLQENIDWENGCFILQKDERCPFLNSDGLCDMILEMGEESLCQICADHPRFRNFLSDRTEIGLGLCCEAAAELVLSRQEPMRLITLEDDGGDEAPDAGFLTFREKLLTIVQDRTRPMVQRVDSMLEACGVELQVDASHWAAFLMTLERLDDGWADMLNRLKEPEKPIDPKWETPLEQLMAYLLFRHLSGALEDGDVQGRVAFCAVIWRLLRRMMRDDLPEICRMYSSEIEYSDENIAAIIGNIE